MPPRGDHSRDADHRRETGLVIARSASDEAIQSVPWSWIASPPARNDDKRSRSRDALRARALAEQS
jgi:hypothetical protein